MKKTIKSTLLLIAFMAVALTTQAQKFGFVNSQIIMNEMPAVKQMNSNLEALQKQLQKKGASAVEQLQKDYMAIQQKVEKGLLSPIQQQEEGKKLEDRQKKIGEMEKDMITQLQDKRSKESEPIISKINDAINAVAKEGGFAMIFDQSSGIILFNGDDSNDVTDKVKAKLGI